MDGENFDGHDYIEKAFENGASIAFVSNKWYQKNKESYSDKPLVTARSGFDALHKLALHHRLKFKIPIVAIAGSNGKTTTKNLATEILEKKYKVLSTYKNFNNQVGVPLMLLNLDEEIEVAVLEIGTNMYGEIGLLTKLVRPTHGLVTNIAEEHLEFLIDIDGVELEETALFAWCRQNNSYSLINVDDQRLKRYAKALEKRMTYGRHLESNLRVKAEFDDNYFAECRYIFHDKKISVKLNMPGESAVQNSTAAALIGFLLEVDEEKIKEALENYQDKGDSYGRMSIVKKDNFTIYNDTYNSNPASLENSYDILLNSNYNRKIAVVGDMKELGEASKKSHEDAVKKAENIFDLSIFYGDKFQEVNHLAKDKLIFAITKDEIKDILINENRPETALLLKGSRSMKMEDILNFI